MGEEGGGGRGYKGIAWLTSRLLRVLAANNLFCSPSTPEPASQRSLFCRAELGLSFSFFLSV